MSNLLISLIAQTPAGVEVQSPAAAAALPIIFGLGFLAAVTLGSIAWYNSKRPVGWEDKERPDVVPEVNKEENPGIGTPNS